MLHPVRFGFGIVLLLVIPVVPDASKTSSKRELVIASEGQRSIPSDSAVILPSGDIMYAVLEKMLLEAIIWPRTSEHVVEGRRVLMPYDWLDPAITV